MAINIQSLFSDIIETPAQRQERMLTEGILKGRELTSGLTGLARTQAPLVSALSMQMPQRQEALRRGVGGMLGLDVRTESEKLQEALRGVDPSKPESLLQAAQTVGNLGFGAQAAQMRQMAAEQKRQQQADLMAQQQFAMQQAAAAENIVTSVQNRELNLSEERRREAGALLQNQLSALNIASKLQDVVNKENMIENKERAAEVITSIGEDYAPFAEIARMAQDPASVLFNVIQMELEKQSVSPYELVDDVEFQNALQIAKDHPTLGKEFKDGWLSDPNISDEQFRDYFSRLRASNPGKSQSEIVQMIASQNEIGLAQTLSQVDVQSVAEQVAGAEAQGGVNLEDMEAAAAALASEEGQAPAQKAPSQLSQQDINRIGFVPQGYTQMTSGAYVLRGDSEDWQGESFRPPNREEARRIYGPEIQEEYRKLQQSGEEPGTALFNKAIENVINKKFPQ